MNSNILRSCSRSLSDDDIRMIEDRIGRSLPSSLVNLYIQKNGGIPERCYWNVVGRSAFWLKKFLPLDDAQGKGRTLDDVYLNGISKKIIPNTLVPFAIDHGGNYFCLDESEEVCFYAMDAWNDSLSVEQNQAKAKLKLGVTLRAFLEGLVSEEEADL